MLALKAYEAKRLDEATAYCQKALQNKPDNPACLHLMGTIDFCLGHKDEAERLMRLSITLSPGFPENLSGFLTALTHAGAGSLIGKTASGIQQCAFSDSRVQAIGQASLNE
jgi:tetratricopeptide (TPR) repeat protein